MAASRIAILLTLAIEVLETMITISQSPRNDLRLAALSRVREDSRQSKKGATSHG